jgi:hypothetical protein
MTSVTVWSRRLRNDAVRKVKGQKELKRAE